MRRLVLLTSVLLALALLPGSAHAACPWTGSHPSTVSKLHVLVATFCLVNSERTRRGLRPLSYNTRLGQAAQNHASDMVRRHYFSHVTPGGSTLVDRIRRTGYFVGARWWTVGENIAWGSGGYATPSSIVRAWMNSSGHRRNILSPGFRETGLGVALGSPWGHARAATYVNTFGARG
jgi:uncharacterized protein YkwD